jgi:outer membrane immunogenic protein
MNRFRTALLTSAAMIAVSGTAYAADLPMPHSVDPIAYTNWEGGYIGGHIGIARLNTTCSPLGYEDDYTCGYESGTNNNTTGMLGGVQAGYNFQNGNVVFGAVADWAWTTLNHTTSLSHGSYSFQSSVDWLASFRGKMGLAVGNTDVYITGGPALGQLHAKSTASDEGVYSQFNGTQVGWAAGLGVEHKINQHWSVNAEFLYYDLGNVTGDSNYHSETYQHNFSFEIMEARAGFNYHF